jgi:hypothetical protein
MHELLENPKALVTYKAKGCCNWFTVVLFSFEVPL